MPTNGNPSGTIDSGSAGGGQMRFFLLLATLLACSLNASAQQQWGCIKGRVAWAGAAVPPRGVLNIAPGQLPPGIGPLFDDSLLIDAQNKGVQNVMVWLVDPSGGKLPIHPKHAAVPAQAARISWGNLQFEPRITMMRAGQPLDLLNNSPVAENPHIVGRFEINGAISLLIPAGQRRRVAGNLALRAEPRPLSIYSGLHSWMSGRIGVFDHPYFTLTDKNGDFEIRDAPAGNYTIMILHE